MLPYFMLSSHSAQSPSPSPGLSFLRNSLPRRCRCGASAPRVFARFVFSSKPFGIRVSRKHASNSHRIRTFKTQDLKPFRMCIYEKTRGEGVLLLTRHPMKGVCPERPSGAKDLATNPTTEGSGPVGKGSYPECVSCIPNASTGRRTEAGRFFGAGFVNQFSGRTRGRA
jgi:hypothetical protein